MFECSYGNISLSTTPTNKQRKAKKAHKEAQKVAATQIHSILAACHRKVKIFVKELSNFDCRFGFLAKKYECKVVSVFLSDKYKCLKICKNG